MANLVWMSGANCTAIIDNSGPGTSVDTFDVVDKGGSQVLLRINEAGVAQLTGDIDHNGARTDLGGTGTGAGAAIEFRSGAGSTLVCEVLDNARLNVARGSVGGLQLRTAQPSNVSEGLCYVNTSTPAFWSYLDSKWRYIS